MRLVDMIDARLRGDVRISCVYLCGGIMFFVALGSENVTCALIALIRGAFAAD